MDKKTYMAELERELRRLPKADRDEALLYYAEYFDDAGPEHEAEALEELGSAKNAAEQKMYFWAYIVIWFRMVFMVSTYLCTLLSPVILPK